MRGLPKIKTNTTLPVFSVIAQLTRFTMSWLLVGQLLMLGPGSYQSSLTRWPRSSPSVLYWTTITTQPLWHNLSWTAHHRIYRKISVFQRTTQTLQTFSEFLEIGLTRSVLKERDFCWQTGDNGDNDSEDDRKFYSLTVCRNKLASSYPYYWQRLCSWMTLVFDITVHVL